MSQTKTSNEPLVDQALAEEHGLNAEEWEGLCALVGRQPTLTELGIASALWSEHCSYKSSKVHLEELPSSGEHVVHGPGENAGVVDIGHGWVAAFKIESHNHPSFIEPYQGAATGVGGILRDVFTMGARPIACMDSLHFGAPDAPRMRHLVDGVVRGIGDYGNCVGIPTVGGQTRFHAGYDQNILVNAFALGLARRERVFTAKARGPGNPLLYVGSRTGRDGIHGATMASESFDAESESKRPTVQVGDPFTEKILLEACLEVMRTGAVVAIQDMGAAGLTSSVFEMADSGGVGFTIHTDRVPLREEGLGPYEIMLSESQERMLIVAERGRQEEVARVFRKWDLEVSEIGEVAQEQVGRVLHGSEEAAVIPIDKLADATPMVRRPVEVPKDLAQRHEMPAFEAEDPQQALCRLLDTPELGSKEWVWRQYDHTVRTNTVVGPGGDAAVLALKGTPSGLALTCDVNPVYCGLDPFVGGSQAVAEAVRNLACVGAEPVGLTDCLNFGNPENPEVAWQFRECIHGIANACKALEVPVVSGNVSFYNETEGVSIPPTPTLAMVGVVPDLGGVPVSHFTTAGDRLVLLGRTHDELGGSAYLRLLLGIEAGKPPAVSLDSEERLAGLLRYASFEGMIHTAHDLSEGGFAVALAEAAFAPYKNWGVRASVDLDPRTLFSESQARALVAVPAKRVEEFLTEAETEGVDAVDIGEVTETGRFEVDFDGGSIELDVDELRQLWSTALPRALDL
ncbi:MAG: phosphoribosylformylglycinamidine synthase subunit PurL [Thermoanaerobaculia bacterium]|nr:phosphoribosylformylglycinamidine synthase subunit PurL [Thermoanaerobaculia bacterium]